MGIRYDEFLEMKDNLNAIEWLFCILNLAFDNRFVRVFIITMPQQCNVKCKNYSKCNFAFLDFESKTRCLHVFLEGGFYKFSDQL